MRPARLARGLKHWGRAAALVALLAPAAQAEPRRLTPDEAQREAVKALESGHPDLAFGLAQALTARDPKAFSTQLLLSYAARDTGRTDLARQAGRAAWGLAANDSQRHSAALALAQAQSSAGHRTIAQFWLRRAVELAPTPAERARDIRDFRYVRSRNPWTFTLDAGVSSSSNVNGGTQTDTIWIYGLPFTLSGDAQALSGLESHASLSVQRTVAETEGHLFRLGGNLAGQGYRLSSEAKALAPDAEGSDYAFWASEAYLTGRIRAARGKDEWDLRVLAGHNDYGGAALSNYANLGVGRGFGFEGGRSLHLGASYERQWRLDSEAKSASLRFATLDWQQPLGPGRASIGLSLGQIASDSNEVAHIRKGISFGYDLARPVLGAQIGLSAGYERRDYGPIAFSTEDRTDHKLTLEADALLRNHQFMGFAPEIGLGYQRTRSNWALSDSRALNLSVRVKSAF